MARPQPTRRQALQALGLAAGAALGGCAELPAGNPGDAGADAPGDAGRASASRGAEPQLTRWRVISGGFLAPITPRTGMPAMPGTGMFVKLMAPTALALRGDDLLVLDAGTGRLWRADTMLNTLSGIAGAPTAPGVALALGPDTSAWVLDPVGRQVLRFGRDGRLMQTQRIAHALPSPVALALADGGLTVLLGDGMGAQWSEQRGAATLTQRVAPADEQGRRISGVDGLALRPEAGGRAESLWVLDRLAGAVHRVQRDGRVLQSLGRGHLMQPSALAADRDDQVFVVDQDGRALVCLHADRPALHLGPAQLGVQQIGGIAIDGRVMALSDRLAGQVVLHRLGRPAAP